MSKRSELALAGNVDKITQIQDSILEAMKVYYEEQAANLKHDFTVDATIVDVSKKADGVYTVQSDGARFQAYATAGSYYTNESVLVSIPNGDYNNQKFILGRKTDGDTINTTFSFKLPFDDFIGLQEVNEEDIYGGQFWANKPAEDEQLIYSYSTEEGSLMGCTKLGIQMNVTTLLAKYNPSRGAYGIRVVIKGTRGTTETYRSEDFSQESYFTNYDMYGNTYAFAIPYTQQKVIDISDFLTVKGIDIYFFQDYLFADSANKLIPYANQPSNIELEKIKLMFGVSASEMENEKTFLWTFDSLNYDENEEEKTLNFAWVHKESNGNFTAVKDIEALNKQKENTGYEQTAVHWYRFNYGTVIEDSTSPEKYGGVNWEWLKDFDNQFSITIKPDSKLSREKYKVAVAHDGVYTVSDVLTLQNSEDVEAFTANDEIIFKCLRAVTDMQGNVTLVEDDAIDTFYVYDENNRVLKNDNLEAYSSVDYYLQLYVRNNDLSQYVPLNVFENGQNTGTAIAWAFPQSMTMFNSYSKISINDPIAANLSPDSNEFKNLEAITMKFRIKSNLNVRYIDNTVNAIVTRGNREYYVHKEFQFGRAGSFGHEVTPVIKIINPADGYYLPIKTGYFELRCDLYARDGSIFEASKATYTWNLIGGAQITEDIAGNGEFVGNGTNTIKGVLQNNIPPVFEVTVRQAADYPITIRKGFLIGNNPEYMQQHMVLVPDRVEFKADGASPIYYTNPFEVQKISVDESLNEMKWPEWNISNTFTVQLHKTEVKERPFTQPNGTDILRPAHNEYALRFPTTGTPQWTELLTGNVYFTYLHFTDADGNYVAQSLAFDKNEYPSSLINSWNGTDLTLDEENSAVIAKMIAAGTKDTNNRFTGVAMGDWKDKGDESFEKAGIYGFMNGSQSFAFKTDGTGFIGPSGKGRIEFDGNEALISNASKTCYINLNPVAVSAATTQEDLLTSSNRSFSQYFLYAETPRTEGITDSYLPEDSAFWARKYFNDPNYYSKDYFIVDPNNGILTTGGIVAKYGNLGNWYIGQQGLYQKHTQGLAEGEPSKYMFLGYDGMSPEAYDEEKARIQQWYIDEVSKVEATYKEILYAYDPIHYYNAGIGAKLLAEFIASMLGNVERYKQQWTSINPDGDWSIEEPRYIQEFWEDNSISVLNQLDPGHPHYDSDGNVTGQYMTGYGFTARCIMNDTSIFTAGGQNRAYNNYFLNHVDNSHFTMVTYYYNTVTSAAENVGLWNKWSGAYTIAEFTRLANDCMAAYNKSKESYDQQLEDQRMAPINRENALKDLEAERLRKLERIWETGDSERFCIFAGENEYYDPYFSVTWDGTMSARRGRIGKSSPWYIDDDGLTQENIFGRIYLGNPAKNPHNPWWFDNTTRTDLIQLNSVGTAYETDDEGNYVGFAISAGDKTSDLEATPKTMAMKFGVRLDGFLYSTRGLIGGWSISDTELVSVNGGIRMGSADSYIVVGKGDETGTLEKYSIILDGKRGIIAIKNQGTESASGQIQLAGYTLEALTSGTITYAYSLKTATTEKTYAPIDAQTDYDNTNGWNGGGAGSISGSLTVPSGTTLNDSGSNSVTLETTNLLGIIDRNESGDNAGFGLGICTGLTEDGKKAVVVYPTGATANYSSLGTSGALWNIYANIIDCAGLSTSTGYIAAKTMYMGNELVATQPWVYELLVDVWNAIKSASGGVSSNGASIKGLGAKLNEMAITNIWGKIERHGEYNAFREVFYFATGANKAGEYTFESGTGHYSAYAYHVHDVTAKMSGSTLTVSTTSGAMSSASDTGIDIDHSHTVSASFSNGVFKVEVQNANFNSPSGGGEKTVDITTTTWFKDQLKAAREEGWDLAASIYQRQGNTVYGPGSAYGSSSTYTASASYDHDGDADWSYDSKITSGGTTYYSGISVWTDCDVSASVSWSK